jgi:hypothetical protein
MDLGERARYRARLPLRSRSARRTGACEPGCLPDTVPHAPDHSALDFVSGDPTPARGIGVQPKDNGRFGPWDIERSEVRMVASQPEESAYEIRSSRGGLLVVTDSLYPGWIGAGVVAQAFFGVFGLFGFGR